jgi:TRAP transporter TAXI family solute receptor
MTHDRRIRRFDMSALLRLAAILIGVFGLPGTGWSGEAHWPDTLVIGTASPGGTYYAYGEGLAQLLTRKLGLPVTMRETDGPVENLKLLEAGEIQLAFVTLGIAQQGWSGSGDWTGGRQFRSTRALFPMYDTPFQFIVTSDTGVQSVADLAGKRVGIGPQGGTGGVYTPLLFRAIKTAPSFVTGSWADLAAQLSARKLDALVVVAGVPVPEVTELEKKGNIRNLTLTPSEKIAVRLALPEISPSVIAAGTYPSLRRNYQTVGVYNFAVASANLPDDLVYAILEVVFTHPDEMMQIHPAAAESVPANFARNTILPFHDGAARWYNNKATIGIVRGD